MTGILIVDDHPAFRRGVRQILEEALARVEISEAQNAAEALQHISKKKWGVVVLDINLPGRSGLDLLKDIRRTHPKLRVLVLSMYPEDQYAIRVLKAGAFGYVTKESAPEQLVEAIKKVIGGEKYISPSLAEKLVFNLEPGTERPAHETLSDREYEVMCLIASGKTVTKIAEKLSLSVKTISTYRARILQKMGLENNTEIVQYAVKHHLLN